MTLQDLKSQLHAQDRLLVVADNCTDATADVAVSAGAEVVERHQPERIGKGFALDWGIRYRSSAPPEILIIIDADCRLAPDAIHNLASICEITDRPVQAHYRMEAPEGSLIDHRFAQFTTHVKNFVRPSGCQALNLPCQLMGTGMAFPWETINLVNTASDNIVEDLKLGLDLTVAGSPPVFCPSAVVSSCFPPSDEGANTQRQRWEQGHLGLIASEVPRLVLDAIVGRNWNLLALTLDLAIPPLLLLGILVIVTFLTTIVAGFFGPASMVTLVSGSSVLAYGLAVFLCWFCFGRDVLPVSALPSLIPFAISKLWLYRRLLSREIASVWVRTDRGSRNGLG